MMEPAVLDIIVKGVNLLAAGGTVLFLFHIVVSGVWCLSCEILCLSVSITVHQSSSMVGAVLREPPT